MSSGYDPNVWTNGSLINEKALDAVIKDLRENDPELFADLMRVGKRLK